VAVFGNMSDSHFRSFSHGRFCNIFSLKSNFARLSGNQTGNRFDQFGLPVTFDSGDADDFSGADIERNIF
jgi:hypothetical protein